MTKKAWGQGSKHRGWGDLLGCVPPGVVAVPLWASISPRRMKGLVGKETMGSIQTISFLCSEWAFPPFSPLLPLGSPLPTATPCPGPAARRPRLPLGPGRRADKQVWGGGRSRQVWALAPLSPWLGSQAGVGSGLGFCLAFQKQRTQGVAFPGKAGGGLPPRGGPWVNPWRKVTGSENTPSGKGRGVSWVGWRYLQVRARQDGPYRVGT